MIENGWLAAPEVEAEAVSQCCVCAEPICSGDSYWETEGGDICCECMENMTAAVFLTDVYGKYDGSGVFDGCML